MAKTYSFMEETDVTEKKRYSFMDEPATEPDEDTTPWTTIVAGVKKAGELTRAGGSYDPLALRNWGKVWTTISRLSPGREDLPDWEEQTTAEQLLTGSQAAAWIGMMPIFAQMGISSIAGVKQALRYNKSLRRMFEAFAEQAKKQPAAVTLGPKEYKVIPEMDIMTRNFQRGGMEAVVNNVKQKLGGLDIVKKASLRATIENLAKIQFKAAVPTASAGPQKAVEISKYIIAGLPSAFNFQVADTTIDQARKLIDDAVRQLTVFNDFTLPKRVADVPAKPHPVPELEMAEYKARWAMMSEEEKRIARLEHAKEPEQAKLFDKLRKTRPTFGTEAYRTWEAKLTPKEKAVEAEWRELQVPTSPVMEPAVKAPLEKEITSNKMLSNVGRQFAKKLGIKGQMTWKFAESSADTYGEWTEVEPNKYKMTLYLGTGGRERSQTAIKDTMAHELTHIQRIQQGKPKQVGYHSSDFYRDWDKNREMLGLEITPIEELTGIKAPVREPLPGARIPREEVMERAAGIELRGFVEPTPQPIPGPITEHQAAVFNSLEKEKRISPRLRKQVLNAFHPGARGIGDLNEQEAEQMIKRIKAAPITATHKLYIPPHRGDLLPEHIGRKRPARLESLILPVWREMEVIMAQDIYNKVEPAYIEWQQRVHDMFRTFDDMKKSLKGIKGHEQRIFHFVNGTLPENVTLSPQETVVANQLRAIVNDYADRLKLPPERRLENYIYHTFEAATQRALADKYAFIDEKNKDIPVTDAMASALGLDVPKKLVTSTLFHRFGRKEGLVENWITAMRGMVSQNERYLIMGPVLKEVRPSIAGYPKTSRSYINDWLAYAVLKQEPRLDELINRTAEGAVALMERASKGKISFGANPARTMGYVFAKLGYGGAVAFNLAIVGKNMTQQMLIPPLLHNPANYGLAFGDFFSEKGQYLLKQSTVLMERFPMEAFDPKDVGKWIQKGMAPYKFVDYLNVSMAFLAGARDAQAMNLPPEEVIKYADRIAKISQYSYRAIDMPRFMWQGGGVGRAAGMLQSWPINYFTNYLPELVHGTVTGYDTAGNKLPAHARGRLLEHIAIASLFIYGMYKYRKVDFRKTFGPSVMPNYLAPGMHLSLAIGQRLHGMATNNYDEVKDADYKLRNTPIMFIPAGLQIKKTVQAYQQYTTGVERDWAGRPRRDVSKEEAIAGVFTYPAQRSDYYDTQKKVWELDNRMSKLTAKMSGLQQRGANYNKIQRVRDEQRKLSREHRKFSKKLNDIKRGRPTEDDRDVIEAIFHTWGLWP